MQGDTSMTLSWAEPADAGSLAAAITRYQYRFSPRRYGGRRRDLERRAGQH